LTDIAIRLCADRAQAGFDYSCNDLRQPIELWTLLRVCRLVGLIAYEFKARQFTLAGFLLPITSI
jgi:hypothetical protein